MSLSPTFGSTPPTTTILPLGGVGDALRIGLRRREAQGELPIGREGLVERTRAVNRRIAASLSLAVSADATTTIAPFPSMAVSVGYPEPRTLTATQPFPAECLVERSLPGQPGDEDVCGRASHGPIGREHDPAVGLHNGCLDRFVGLAPKAEEVPFRPR